MLTLEEFLPKARALNPDYTDDEHIQAYEERYGRQAPVQTVSPAPLTTFEEFLPKARALNPDYSDEEHYAAWQEKYGARGAREQDQGDFFRGVGTAFKQIPQTVRGLEAGAGAIGEKVFGEGGLFTALKDHGLKGYQEWAQEIAKESKPSDSVSEAYHMARAGDPGALVDWLQYALGYGGGQALQMLATAGVGYAAGKMTLQPAAKIAAEKLVAKEAARLAATEAGSKLAADQLAKQAVSNVAGKIGQIGALGATAVGMEGGEIYGGLVEKAAEEGRSLTGEELAKATGATLGAGVLEFVGDKIGLDLVLGKSVAGKLVTSRLGHAAAAGSLGVATEGGTEFTQTLIEEFGKGNDPFSPEAIKQAVDAAALGGVGGATVGTAGGLVTRPDTQVTAPTVTERTPEDLGLTEPEVLPGPRQLPGPPQPGEVRSGTVYGGGPVLDVSPLPDVSPVTNASTLDEAIANAVGVVQGATETAKARAAEFARMTAKARNEAERLIATAPEKRAGTDIPILPGPTTEVPSLLNQPSHIVPGTAFTPRPEPEADPRQALADERARMLKQRDEQQATMNRALERASMAHNGTNWADPSLPRQAVQTPRVEPARTPDKPLPTSKQVAADQAYPSVDDLHRLAASKNLDIESPLFREMTRMTTGKRHLDELTPLEREQFAQTLKKIKASTPPVQVEEQPPSVELTPVKEQPSSPVTTIPEAQVPRSELTPEKNAEILLRAEKAKADMEIAGTERGGRFYTEQQGQGGTPEVVGLKSPTPDWYKELTSGPSPAIRGDRKQSARQKIEDAIQKIIKDKGADRGKAVELVKAALLQDREFHQTEWGRDLNSILEGQWPEWIERPEDSTKTSSLEGFPNTSIVNAKFLADFAEREPFKSHGLRSLDVPTQRVVMERMFSVVHDHQIREAVVKAIPVDVMNYLMGKKLTPEALFDNKAMFKKAFPFGSDSLPSVSAVNAADSLVRIAARTAAKFVGVPGVEKPSNGGSAVSAGDSSFSDSSSVGPASNAAKGSLSNERRDSLEGLTAGKANESDRSGSARHKNLLAGSDNDTTTRANEFQNVPRGTAQTEREVIDEAAHEAATSPKNDIPQPTEGQKGKTRFSRATDRKSKIIVTEKSGLRGESESRDLSTNRASTTETGRVDNGQASPPLEGISEKAKRSTNNVTGRPVDAAQETEEPPTPDLVLTAPPSQTVEAKATPTAEQMSIEVPPPTSGERPIIGRETTPEESPLFSKAAQIPDDVQTSLPEGEPPVSPAHESPTDILATALRQAADKIQGRKAGSLGGSAGLDANPSPLEEARKRVATDADNRLDLRQTQALLDVIDNLLLVKPDALSTEKSADLVEAKSASSKRLLQGVMRDTKALRNIIRGKTFLQKGFGGLDGKTQRLVLSHMLSLSQNGKVLDTVVQLIPVDMVDNLATSQFPAEVLLDNPTMLKRAVAENLRLRISLPVNVTDALVRAFAVGGAIEGAGLTLSDLVGPTLERSTTGRTQDRNHRNIDTRYDGEYQEAETKETDQGIALFSRTSRDRDMTPEEQQRFVRTAKVAYARAPNIGDTDLLLADSTDLTPPEILRDLSSDQSIQQAARLLDRATHRFQQALGVYPRASFRGFDVNMRHEGINVTGDLVGRSQRSNHILTNPYIFAEQAQQSIERGYRTRKQGIGFVANRVTRNLIHEITHQEFEGHDADFANRFKYNYDTLHNERVSLIAQLTKILEATNDAGQSFFDRLVRDNARRETAVRGSLSGREAARRGSTADGGLRGRAGSDQDDGPTSHGRGRNRPDRPGENLPARVRDRTDGQGGERYRTAQPSDLGGDRATEALTDEPYSFLRDERGSVPVTGTIDTTQARDRLQSAKPAIRPYLLGALGLEQIAQVYGHDHAEVRHYNQATQAMEADFVEMSRDSEQVIKSWTQLKIPVADAMAQVMEDARFLNFDPDPKKNQEADSQKKKDLRTRFEALPDDAKTTYRLARDFYTDMAEKRFQALKERIERAGGTPENKKKLVDRLQLAYEQVRSKVYFPFTRFGEHIVVAKQMKDGKEVDREVHAFESVAEAQKFASMMKLKGWQVKQTVAKEYSVDKEGPASKIVRQMSDIIKELDEQPGLPGVQNLTDQLLDSLNQSFLQALPDMSYAKHFIHAKDVKGASKDALRAFAHSALHGAHHISRIRHADKMTAALLNLDERINKTSEGDVTEARQVYNELVQRHNEILNPSTHPVSAWLGQLGFTMSLGGVVATGVTNATQVPLITYPWLGARYGFGKASTALARAYRDFLDPRTLNKESLFDASKSKLISESERKMLLELARRGRIDLTQTMDLAGLSAQDNLSRVARMTGTTQQKVLRMLGFTFHAPEVMNRQVTALAAFRLEKEKGRTFEEALQRAEQAIIDTHFLYQAFNRPRYMSGNVLRVLTMFRQYSQNIAFLYGRAASIWLDKNNATAEERQVAKRQLLSMLALQLGAAGALGMPFFGAGIDVLMSVVSAFGDDDDKRDWEVALRQWLDGTATSLAEAFISDKEKAREVGREIGEVISHGASRLTPWDMAARLGQQDLFFRSPQREREGRAAAMDWLTSLSGPVVGYAVNAYLGVSDVAKGLKEANAGFFMRGVEELTPAVLRNGVKALRYTIEDVRTRDQYKQLELRKDETLGQFFGFTPSRVAEMYESITAVKNKEHRILNQRKSLLDRFARTVTDRDLKARQRVLEDIREFNSRNRIFAITSDTLNRSLKTRMQHEQGMERGMYLPPKRRQLLEEGDFAVVGQFDFL